jgi:hypothetical protein
MEMKGYPHSNLGRRSTNGWPRVRLLPWLFSAKAERCGRHGHQLEGSNFPLTTVETTERKPVMRKQLGRPSMAVGMTSSGPPAPRTPSAVAGRRGLLLQVTDWNGRLCEVDQRWWLAWRQWLGVGSNPHGVGLYL